MRKSRALSDRAAELRKIAAQSKSRIGRDLARQMAKEKEREAEETRAQEETRAATKH